jgi:hypothetical protein
MGSSVLTTPSQLADFERQMEDLILRPLREEQERRDEQERREKECIAWTIAAFIVTYLLIILYVSNGEFENFALFYLFGYNMIEAGVCFIILLIVLFVCVGMAVLIDIHILDGQSPRDQLIMSFTGTTSTSTAILV